MAKKVTVAVFERELSRHAAPSWFKKKLDQGPEAAGQALGKHADKLLRSTPMWPGNR